MNLDKILELQTQILTILEIETILIRKRVELEKECNKLKAEEKV